jgi:hypothetical protein
MSLKSVIFIHPAITIQASHSVNAPIAASFHILPNSFFTNPITRRFKPWDIYEYHLSSLAYGPAQHDSPYRLVFCFLLLSLDTHRFQTFSIQSNHLNFRFPTFLLPSNTHRNTSFTVLSSDILTRWPALSSLLDTVPLVTISGFLYITCYSSLFRILQLFLSFIASYILRYAYRR